MRPRIYIDTSVFGGCYDVEFEQASCALFERIKNKDFDVYFSEVNETELVNAPQHIRDLVNLIPKDCYNFVKITDEVEELMQKYIENKALGKASENDAYHIAIATINRIDCLISWNFKHIVNFDKIKLFNSVNLAMGYSVIDIRSPLEFL